MSAARSRHSYSGQSVAERQVERRALFFEAALTVFAEKTYAHSSITDICAAAGLSRRQFYEQYSGREELLVEVYDRIQEQARDAVAQALTAAGAVEARGLMDVAIRAYTEAIVGDIRKAKVAFVEIVGVSEAVERHRLEVRDRWGAVVETAASALPGVRTPPGGWRVAMAAFIGAVNGLVHQWSLDDPRPPVDVLVEVLTTLLVALALPGDPAN
ncbi:TetR/AcrR family transcriptional regulator [Nocardia bhagyanarayanae]|uniref:TetR/AcrR family transcriptional regulator n=1 Tax=Nocardia bhagyanarayanae TaxID=1215925 RepID=UPI0011523A06|nr:TetR/AcrR family transcriptional regulator [Nocardia bhagyanarayanae]